MRGRGERSDLGAARRDAGCQAPRRRNIILRMLPARDGRPHPLLLASLAVCGAAALSSCGAPAEEDEGPPEYAGLLGAPPGAAPPGPALPGQPAPAAPGSSAPTGVTPSGATPEAIGNPAGVPISGGNTDNSGAGSAGSPGAGGAGGSASPPAGAAPSDGAGGSAMPGAAGNGSAPAPTEGATPPIDAPPPDTSTPPVDVTPPPVADVGGTCATGEGFFCENFDAAPLGAVSGTLNGLRPENGVSIIDEAGRGRVLQVLAGSTYDNKNGVFLDLAAANASHFGRAFIRVAGFPSAGGDHWVIVEATSSAGGDQVRPVGGQFSRWAPGADGPSANDWTDWQQSDAATTPGAWECVEWQLDATNGNNDILLWVNGTQVTPLERGNFRIPAIDELWLGWVVYQNADPPMYDVRFDDIVLGSARIGCD
jgi:hypothetical protein